MWRRLDGRQRNVRGAKRARALTYLLFDHAGGINTMLHTLFNRCVVVVPSARTSEALAADLVAQGVELLVLADPFRVAQLVARARPDKLP